jgi:hypothetical protein
LTRTTSAPRSIAVRPVVRLVDGEDVGSAVDTIEAVLADLVRVRDQKRRRFDELAGR